LKKQNNNTPSEKQKWKDNRQKQREDRRERGSNGGGSSSSSSNGPRGGRFNKQDEYGIDIWDRSGLEGNGSWTRRSGIEIGEKFTKKTPSQKQKWKDAPRRFRQQKRDE